MESDLVRVIKERIAQHNYNIELWDNGYLNPTEPDTVERNDVFNLPSCFYCT